MGTQAVINGELHKGRVEAATASGKSLCIYHNVLDSFKTGRNIAVVVIPWLTLIDQTFKDFYVNKMFGYDDKNGVYNPHNTSCIIARSGGEVKCDPTVTDVFQNLSPELVAGRIISETTLGKNVVLIITKDSYMEKYVPPVDSELYGKGILDILFEKGVKKEKIIEIIDEYHNIIPSSGLREDHLKRADYLITYSDRNSGTIFYSASNKRGDVVNSLDEEQFGPLLCKVTRNDLRIRGYVCPKLMLKFLMVKPLALSSEAKRNAVRKGLDIDKAQTEAAGVVSAFNDLRNYYNKPNLITFGDHVAACKQIKEDPEMMAILSDVNLHFMSSDTPRDEREIIIDKIKISGNNILNQHSVAKEGVNIPNLHGGLIDRGMDYKSAQQAIGRSDRAIYDDTVKFMNGELSLDNPDGWIKFWNIIYLIVDDNEVSIKNRLKDVVRYLLTNGIPEEEWDFSSIDDEERSGPDPKTPNPDANLDSDCGFNEDKLRKMIQETILEVQEDLLEESIEDEEREPLDVKGELMEIEEDNRYTKEGREKDNLNENDWLDDQFPQYNI